MLQFLTVFVYVPRVLSAQNMRGACWLGDRLAWLSCPVPSA